MLKMRALVRALYMGPQQRRALCAPPATPAYTASCRAHLNFVSFGGAELATRTPAALRGVAAAPPSSSSSSSSSSPSSSAQRPPSAQAAGTAVDAHELFAAAVGTSLAGAVRNVCAAHGSPGELLDVQVQAFVDAFVAAAPPEAAAGAEEEAAAAAAVAKEAAAVELEVAGIMVRARVTVNPGEGTSNARVQELLARARDGCAYSRGGRARVSVVTPSGMWLLDSGPMGEAPPGMYDRTQASA
jgi:hypothetical protein